MTIEIKVEMLGVDNIDRMLRGWSPAARRRIVRPGISKASRHVSRSARAKAPAESGLLRKSIGVVVRTYPNGNVVGVVGPRHGFKKAIGRIGSKSRVITKRNVGQVSEAHKVQLRNPVKYAHLVEGGTQPHSLGKGSSIVQRRKLGTVIAVNKTGRKYRKGFYASAAGKQEGRKHPGAKPKPFLGPAFQSSLPIMRQIMRDEIGKGVIKEARRLLRKKGFAA